MRQRLSVCAIVALAVFAPLTAHAAKSSSRSTGCFTADEARAAHFRTLQQEFNVAALNCRSADPNDPSISTRYNDFVGRFGGKLQENAQTLRGHFSRAGGNFDSWMTRVANDAAQRVGSDPQFCQRASDDLDKSLTLSAQDLDSLAISNASLRMGVAECSEAKKAAPKNVSEHGKKRKKKKPHPEAVAAATPAAAPAQ